MLRSVSVFTLAILAGSPAVAASCSYGHSTTTAISDPALTAYTLPSSPVQSIAPQPLYSEPASTVTFTDVAPVPEPAVTFASTQPDIVDTAVSAGSFNTLVAAVQAAGLVETLKGPGPFTVFAPSDDAFAALPAGTVESLLLPENRDKLTSILTYHVVPGKVLSGDLAGQQFSTSTVQGTSVAIDGTVGVRIDNANVVTADIETSNGVIHVIDSVLIPNS